MTLRDRIVRAVVGVLAVGGTVAGGLMVASQQEGVTVDVASAEVRAAVLDAAVVLRTMGRSADDITEIVVEQTGAPPEAVAPIVGLAVGRDGRHPRTLRDATLTVLVPLTELAQAEAGHAAAWCAPLLLGGEPTSIHAECVGVQALSGQRYCLDGAEVGIEVAMTLTEAQDAAQRAALADFAIDDVEGALVQRAWTLCGEGQ